MTEITSIRHSGKIYSIGDVVAVRYLGKLMKRKIRCIEFKIGVGEIVIYSAFPDSHWTDMGLSNDNFLDGKCFYPRQIVSG
jgi:hypothetical protein